MVGVYQADRPEFDARAGIGVECVQAVVLCGHKNHIVLRAAHRQIRDPERLAV